MNAEKILSFYDKIAEAPESVSGLRRFVHDCAVSGRLVKQSAADEPALELLQKIATSKETLIKSGKIRKPKGIQPISKTPFDLPETWEWVRFGDIVDFAAGKTPPRNESSFWDNGVSAWVSIADMKDGGIVQTTKETVSSRAQTDIFKAEPAAVGTMIMSFKLTIGKIARLGVPAFHNEAIISIKPHLEELDSFLFKFLPIFARSTKSKGAIKGATLNRESISNILLPLPPLAEQNRIVARVDELMALCDKLKLAKAEREYIRKNLTTASFTRLGAPSSNSKKLKADATFALGNLNILTAHSAQIAVVRQTIFNLAVRGRLTEQNATDESASKLLKRITAYKKQRIESIRNKRIDISAPAVVSTPPYEAPNGWLWVQFGDITISRDGERVPVSKEERKKRTKTYDYYGASGVIDKIDGYLFDKPLLLIGEDGANLINRSTPIAFIARGKYWVNNHAHVLDGLSEEYLRYIEIFINAIDLKPYVTGSAQPKMNQKKMNSIPVALPPLAEQKRIVAKVDELMALCDELEANLAVRDAARKDLMAAVLREAFEVPA